MSDIGHQDLYILDRRPKSVNLEPPVYNSTEITPHFERDICAVCGENVSSSNLAMIPNGHPKQFLYNLRPF